MIVNHHPDMRRILNIPLLDVRSKSAEKPTRSPAIKRFKNFNEGLAQFLMTFQRVVVGVVV